uniref:hypothetical protein n=1 Tax=Hafnia paralvei TaxID=546367 RepID=UPI0026DD9B14
PTFLPSAEEQRAGKGQRQSQKIKSKPSLGFSLSLGRESRHDRDVVTEFGAPWMGDTKPERRWHLG